MTDPKALTRLDDLTDELSLEVAEFMAEAGEDYQKTIERGMEIAAGLRQIRRMAGLPEREMPRIARKVRRAS